MKTTVKVGSEFLRALYSRSPKTVKRAVKQNAVKSFACNTDFQTVKRKSRSAQHIRRSVKSGMCMELYSFTVVKPVTSHFAPTRIKSDPGLIFASAFPDVGIPADMNAFATTVANSPEYTSSVLESTSTPDKGRLKDLLPLGDGTSQPASR